MQKSYGKDIYKYILITVQLKHNLIIHSKPSIDLKILDNSINNKT